VEAARRNFATSLGVVPDHVVFQPSVTYGVNAAIRGSLGAGAHVVVDNRAHNCVLRTVANAPGITFTVSPLHALDDSLHLPALEHALTPATRLVALTAVSNVTGSIYDVGTAVRMIRRIRPDVGILVDAAQAAGMADLGPSLEADFVVFGSYKYLHGVPGAAVLVARHPLRPTVFGGTGTSSATLRVEDLPTPPARSRRPERAGRGGLRGSVG